ncbi:MAG: hypothetical protein HGA31_05070 [Candidatus Moranbacteria bacterium]|nr:hypothetical protein [Candidatus Moranbacteria bacterium]
MSTIEETLGDIGIPDPAQKIYVTLLKDGEATARTLSLRTGITRTSVYDQIKILRGKALVVEKLVGNATFFAIGDTRQLSLLLTDRIDRLSSQQDSLDETLHSLMNTSRFSQPKIRFFEGEDGMRQLMKDILWYDDITLRIYWSYEKMLHVLGEDFLLWFNERRKVRDIPVKTIWGSTEKNKTSIFDDGEDVERRYFSRKDAPTMSYILYDKKVAFISSQKESFGFIVESAEFADLMSMQFDTLWGVAKK